MKTALGRAIAIGLMASAPAYADAMFDAFAEVTLFPTMNNGDNMFPDVWTRDIGHPNRQRVSVVNTVGWVHRSPGTADTHTEGFNVELIDWIAEADADAIPSTPGFPMEGPHADLEVGGTAFTPLVDDSSYSLAEAWVTGARTDIYNAGITDVWMDWTLTVDWAAALFTDPLIPDDANYAAFGFSVFINGVEVFSETEDVADGDAFIGANTHTVDLSFEVFGTSRRELNLDVYMYGLAWVDAIQLPPPFIPPPPPFFPPLDPPPVIVPEPGTLALLGMGLSGLAVRWRRRLVKGRTKTA